MPGDGRADVILALAVAQRPDGGPSLATRAVAERAVELFGKTSAGVLILSGGARVVPKLEATRSTGDSNDLPPGFTRAGRLDLGAQAGISEARAMRTVVSTLGVTEDVVLDEAECHRRGTHHQPVTFASILSGRVAGRVSADCRVILVAHPRHLPRALWLFRRALPTMRFYAANADEIYDPLSTQWRLRGRWRFCLWNLLASVHHLLFVPRVSRARVSEAAPQ